MTPEEQDAVNQTEAFLIIISYCLGLASMFFLYAGGPL
jgi:hypothetical protein